MLRVRKSDPTEKCQVTPTPPSLVAKSLGCAFYFSSSKGTLTGRLWTLCD